MTTQDCVVAVYGSVEQAHSAVALLQRRGWTDRDISLMAPRQEGEAPVGQPLNQGDRMEKNAGIGAAAGATLGLLAGSSLLLIPGVGPVLFAGAMASGITGGLVGGIVGAMSGWGVKKDHALEYEQELRDGKTVVAVTGDPQRLAEAQSVMQNTPAEKVTLHAETADSETIDA